MAADSDGTLTAVVICEGDLHDPCFPKKLKSLLGKLKSILEQPKRKKRLIKINKVEPWNSVRVTLSIPKEAAAKLRQLAAEGSAALRALGILSVQLEGDTVISLRLVGQEIVLRTDNNQSCSNTSSGGLDELANILAQPQSQSSTSVVAEATVVSDMAVAGPSRCVTPSSVDSVLAKDSIVDTSKSAMFKSPNTVCPMDGKLPTPVPSNIVEAREYPFESMTQARVIHRRENTLGISAPINIIGNFVAPQPPPPYPTTTQKGSDTKSTNMQINPGNIAISSPLLVNLLQNEVANNTQGNSSAILKRGQELVLVTSLPRTHLGSHGNATNIVVSDEELLLSKSSGINKVPINIQQLSQTQTMISDVANANNSECTLTNIRNTISARNSNLSDVVVQTQQQHKQSSSIVAAGNVGTMTTVPSPNINLKLQQTRFLSQPQQHQQMLGNQQVRTMTPFPQQQQITPQTSVSMQLQKQQRHQLNKNSTTPQLVSQSPSTLRHNTRFPVYQQQSVPIIQSSSIRTGMQQTFRQALPNEPNLSASHPHQIITNSTNVQPLITEINSITNSTQINIDEGSQSTYNPRWPLKPMDSATKSSFQEFTRYQMQYNLIQQQQQQQSSTTSKNGSNASDTLGLQQLADLDELTKNDLDSLLPSLNDGDLDTALCIDSIRNPLDSLLDTKDLVLDLIEQTPLSSGNTSSNIVSSNSSLSTALPTASISAPSASSKKTHGNSLKIPAQPPAKLTSTGNEPQFLINPLTGELEPIPSEDSCDDDDSAAIIALNMTSFPEFNSEMSNSMYSDDDNSCSTAFSKTTSDHSDNERSSNSENSSRSRSSGKVKTKERKESNKRNKISKDKTLNKNSMLREKLHQGLRDKLIYGKSKCSGKEKYRAKNVSTPIISAATISESSGGSDSVFPEKIKLKLKLEKSEPVSAAYKVDISFVPSPKRAQSSSTSTNVSTSSLIPASSTIIGSSKQTKVVQHQNTSSIPTSSSGVTSSAAGSNLLQNLNPTPAGEELRVPPLHISLRGRNSVVIKNLKKDRKKSHSGGEEDEFGKKSAIKKTSSILDGCASPLITVQKVLSIPNHHHRSQSMDDIDSVSETTNINFSKSKGQSTQSNYLMQKAKQSNKAPTLDSVKNDISAAFNSYGSLSVQLTKVHHENGSNCSVFKMNTDHTNNILQTSKRASSDFVYNPNGTISPEKKRRLSLSTLPTSASTIVTLPTITTATTTIISTASTTLETKSNCDNLITTTVSTTPEFTVKDYYCQLDGPIGSTNVGTLPQHSSLSTSKNQKSNNNNNNPPFNKIQRTVSKLKCKSPNSFNRDTSETKKPTNNLDGCDTERQITQQQQQQHQQIQDVGSCVNSSTSSLVLPSNTKLFSTNNVSIKDLKNVDKITSLVATSSVTNITDSSSKIISPEIRPNNKSNVVKHISHYSNRPPEATTSASDSPKDQQCPEAGNCMPPSVRGSPGSQVQGEDSGIESMDALSEKSPHQSSSPQGETKRSETPPKDSSKQPQQQKTTVINVDDFTNIVDIEAALAKMEGINELIACDTSNINVGTQKLNGDHVTIVRSRDLEMPDTKTQQNTDKIRGCCSTTGSTALIQHHSNVDAVKKSILSENIKDLDENRQCSTKKTIDDNSSDCANTTVTVVELKTDSLSVKCEKDEISETQELINQLNDYDEDIKSTIERKNTNENQSEMSSITIAITENSTETFINKNDQLHRNCEDKEEILTQLSIEIPTGENEVPRVRTRASSKLESPLDISKQSPDCVIATPTTTAPAITNCTKSVKLASATVDRLSPKITGKSVKRKRQGSESSNQSTLSDDNPARGKKAKKTTIENVTITITTSTTSAPATVVTTSTVVTSTAHQVPTTSTTLVKQSYSNSSSSSCSSSSSSNSSASSISIKKPIENSKNQSLKNFSGKVVNINDDKKIGDESSDSDEPLIEIAGKVRNSKLVKFENEKVLRNHQKFSNSNKSTNYSVIGSNIVATKSSTFKASSSGIDDKTMTMSTRRSVRMNLNVAQNKFVGKAATSASTISGSITTDEPKKVSILQNLPKHNSTNATLTEQSGEARRKTRSATGVETTGEGRRRRGSRDSK